MELNRHHRLERPSYHEAIVALSGAAPEDWLAGQPFALGPVSDSRPFFHNFFRWRSAGQFAAARERGGLAQLESGYVLVVAALAQAVLAATALILLPLAPGALRGAVAVSRARVLVYFAGVGIGFLSIEIAFIHALRLLLHDPVISAAVALTGFLLSAGAGSALSPRVALAPVLAFIVALALLAALVLGPVLAHFAGAPVWARHLLCALLIAPLGFAMGIPFPKGLTALRARAPTLAPWAWGINGCASVVSAVGATLLALHAGFAALLVAAALAYAGAWLARV